MLVRVKDPTLVESLINFLEARGCVVERVAETELDVFCLTSTRHDLVPLELDLYVELWQATQRGARAKVVSLDRR